MRTCQRCGCCGRNRDSGCDGGEEHCERVVKWSKLDDGFLFEKLHELFNESDPRFAEAARDALLARNRRYGC